MSILLININKLKVFPKRAFNTYSQHTWLFRSLKFPILTLIQNLFVYLIEIYSNSSFISINNENIKQVKNATFLGIVIDEFLTCNAHLQ